MHTIKLPFALAAAAFLTACNHVEATHNRCGGTTACAKAPCDPIDVLADRPNRPFTELGVVEVRVDRGTALKNTTLADAMPALVSEGRAMGADAIILTHEEFTNWYDKGEPASPIHDLERQESWYITEKARYVSGLAVVYTGGACAAPYAPAPVASILRGSARVTNSVPTGSRTMECFRLGADGVWVPAPCVPVQPYGPPAPAPAPVYVAPTPVYVAPAPAPAPTPIVVPLPPPAPEPVPAPVINPDPPQVPGVPDLPPVPRPPDVPPVPVPPPDLPK